MGDMRIDRRKHTSSNRAVSHGTKGKVLYGSAVEWMERHVVAGYIVEIMLIVAFCIYGVMSGNGFNASGY